MDIAFTRVERGASPSAGSRAFIAKHRGLALLAASGIGLFADGFGCVTARTGVWVVKWGEAPGD
jgi:hypothetical protein